MIFITLILNFSSLITFLEETFYFHTAKLEDFSNTVFSERALVFLACSSLAVSRTSLIVPVKQPKNTILL